MNRVARVVTAVVVTGGLIYGAISSEAQEKNITQTAGVDNTRMGAYRALAELTYEAFRKRDNTTAAELARVLELTWDQGQYHNTSDKSFCKEHASVCHPIDDAMDDFIRPIMNYSKKAPDPGTVKAAFEDFLEKLEKAE